MIRSSRRLLLVTVSVVSLLTADPAAADTFAVDRTDDAVVSDCTPAPNDCSLRGAITAAEKPTDQVEEQAITCRAPASR